MPGEVNSVTVDPPFLVVGAFYTATQVEHAGELVIRRGKFVTFSAGGCLDKTIGRAE
jgi:hypothetical protein